jgi:hypothetical protein
MRKSPIYGYWTSGSYASPRIRRPLPVPSVRDSVPPNRPPAIEAAPSPGRVRASAPPEANATE